MHLTTRRTWTLSAALAIAVGTGALVGCGDDDTASTADDEPAASDQADQSTSSTAGPEADLAAACDDYIAITQAFSNSEQPDLELIEARTDELEANVPEEIAEPLGVVIAGVRDGLAGDDAFFEDESFMSASAETDAFILDRCDLDGTLEVTGVDFGYEGIPETVSAGLVGVAFENTSPSELHEMVVIRKDDGVTETFEELLEGPEEEAESKTTFAGHVFAPPGASGTTFLDLEPGEYLAVCFIPQGATMDSEVADGPPHFVLGMQQTFTVR